MDTTTVLYKQSLFIVKKLLTKKKLYFLHTFFTLTNFIFVAIEKQPKLSNKKKQTTELYYFHVSVGWTLAINFDILIVKTSKNTKLQIFLMFERLDQKLPKRG